MKNETPSVLSRISGQEENSSRSKLADSIIMKKYTKEEIVKTQKIFYLIIFLRKL